MKLLTTVFVSPQVKAHRAGVDQPFTQPLMEMNRKEWLRRHFCFQRSGALQSLQPLGPDVRKLQRQLVCRSPRSLRRIFITLVSTCVHAYERAWKGQRTTQIQSIRSHTPHWKQGLSLTWSSQVGEVAWAMTRRSPPAQCAPLYLAFLAWVLGIISKSSCL